MCVCVCVFFFRMCATNNMCMCHLWRDIFNGRTHHPHPDATDTDTHNRQLHNHTPNHTTTHQTTQTHHTTRQPTPTHPGGTRRAHELEAKGFFRVSYTEGFFSIGNKGFFRGGSQRLCMLTLLAASGGIRLQLLVAESDQHWAG